MATFVLGEIDGGVPGCWEHVRDVEEAVGFLEFSVDPLRLDYLGKLIGADNSLLDEFHGF